MSSSIPETQVNQSVSFLPTADEPATGAEQLAALEDVLSETTPVDLIVAQDPPPPIGRSYAYDFSVKRFVRSASGKGPAGTVGEATLRGWIEKCLSTARGAHPIHPPGYGLLRPDDMIGGPVAAPPVDLEQRIRDALTFHPRITNIDDFGAAWDDDEEYVSVSFTVITDRDERIPIDAVPIAA